MKLIEIEKKSRILKRLQFGCLQDSYSVNVTRGCSFRCVYCYARGYPEAPDKDKIYLYANLPQKIAQEMDSPRRRLKVDHVSFNTATDCFQNHSRVLEIAYQSMYVFLRRGVNISFLTKGSIPEVFLTLFAKYSQLVRAAIGLVSTSEEYKDTFEPGAANIQKRLASIGKLKSAGIEVQARIDPIIPFLTDDQKSIEKLMAALAEKGINTVSLSYLHLRPRILEQLKLELPGLEFKLLQSCFSGQDWTEVGTSTRSKLVPKSLRRKGYDRFSVMANKYGIKTLVCSCKNPDMNAQICSSHKRFRSLMDNSVGKIKQLSLFE